MKRAILTVLVSCIFAVGALAQTNFYVSPSGSDSNNGLTPSSAWATIGHAASALSLGSGGAVVNVAPGNYNQCITTNRIGSSSQPIVYQSTTQYGAKLTCGSATQVWLNGTSTVNASYVTITGFDVTATGSVCYGIVSYGAHNTISSNYSHDIPAPTSNCGDGAGGAGIGIFERGTGLNVGTSVVQNIVDNIGAGATTGCNNQHGIYVGAEQVTVQNNIVSRACGYGIHIYGYTTTEVISNNVVINNDLGGIIVSANGADVSSNDHTSVINNIVANNGGLHGANQSYGITEQSGPTGPNNVYRNNILYGNAPNNTINFSNGPKSVSGTVVPSGSQFSSLFIDYTGNAKTGNYALSSSSLAAGAGITGSCASGGLSPCVPTVDFAGLIRSTPPAIGAFDIASADSPPSAPKNLTATVQ
jgi:hypothetical protein